MPQGIQGAKGKVVRVRADAPARERVLVAWFKNYDPGKTGTRKKEGGLAELYVESFFSAYFNVPTIDPSEVIEAGDELTKTAAYTSTQRSGVEFSAAGEPVQIEGFTKSKNSVITRAPRGIRVIVPSQETREVTYKNKKYGLSKTASCTFPYFFNVFMCKQLIGTMLRNNQPLRIKINGKRYQWKKYKEERHTDSDGTVADSGAWILTAPKAVETELPFVDDDYYRETFIANM